MSGKGRVMRRKFGDCNLFEASFFIESLDCRVGFFDGNRLIGAMEEVEWNLGVKFISFLAEECLKLRTFSIFRASQLSFAAAKMFSRFPAPRDAVGDLVVTANSAARFLFPRVVSDAPIP
jgi:hypothetical protein